MCNVRGIQSVMEINYQCKPTIWDYVDVQLMQDILLKPISVYGHIYSQTEDVYFSHSDHLGSANWITDAAGQPIQYIHYAPFGELIADTRLTNYRERFKFTGKERDEESGYDYFGARYYWSLLMHWLSVDPLAHKYPWLSPYAYCNWNPVKNVDPNDKWVETVRDIANVALDVASLKTNVSEGNVGGAIVDGFGLLLDAGATLLPCVPGGAGTAIKAYRVADKANDAGKLGKAIDKVITATKSTYRKALQQATGKLGKGYEAHHTLPQKYRDKFEKLGINIDEPGNVVWRTTEGHRAKNTEHGKEWDEFFKDNPSPTKEQVIEFRDHTEQKVWGNTGDSPLQ